MDWLTEASGGVELHEILDVITAGSLIGFCLIPTAVVVILIGLITRLIKRRKKRSGDNKNTNNKNPDNKNKVSTTKEKAPVLQLGTTPKRKRGTGLGMTGAQLHAELNYDTVDSHALDNMTEPNHSMDLNMEFDSKGKIMKNRRKH